MTTTIKSSTSDAVTSVHSPAGRAANSDQPFTCAEGKRFDHYWTAVGPSICPYESGPVEPKHRPTWAVKARRNPLPLFKVRVYLRNRWRQTRKQVRLYYVSKLLAPDWLLTIDIDAHDGEEDADRLRDHIIDILVQLGIAHYVEPSRRGHHIHLFYKPDQELPQRDLRAVKMLAKRIKKLSEGFESGVELKGYPSYRNPVTQEIECRGSLCTLPCPRSKRDLQVLIHASANPMGRRGLCDLLKLCAPDEDPPSPNPPGPKPRSSATPLEPRTSTKSVATHRPDLAVAAGRIRFDYDKLAAIPDTYRRKLALAALSIKNGDTFDIYAERYAQVAEDDHRDDKRARDLQNAWANIQQTAQPLPKINTTPGEWTFDLDRFNECDRRVRKAGIIDADTRSGTKLRGKIAAAALYMIDTPSAGTGLTKWHHLIPGFNKAIDQGLIPLPPRWGRQAYELFRKMIKAGVFVITKDSIPPLVINNWKGRGRVFGLGSALRKAAVVVKKTVMLVTDSLQILMGDKEDVVIPRSEVDPFWAQSVMSVTMRPTPPP